MTELRLPDINSVAIAGNLTRDPVFRKTTNGTPVTNFWIASNRKFKDNNGHWRENVCYVGVVAWYKLAENCAQNLAKGNAILVEGELQSRSLRTDEGRNRNIVEIKARRVQFLNKIDTAVDEDDIPAHVEVNVDSKPTTDNHDEKQTVSTLPVEDKDKTVEDSSEEQFNEEEEPVEDSAPSQSEDSSRSSESSKPTDFDFGYQNIQL